MSFSAVKYSSVNHTNSKKERGKILEEMSTRLNTCETAEFRVKKRAAREPFKLIKEQFKRKIREEVNSWEIDAESLSKNHQNNS